MGRTKHPQPALSRRGLLLGMGLLPTLSLALARRGRAAGPRKLLIVWNPGGWDTSYVFDPHFESTVIEQDPNSTLATVNGISFADSAARPSVRSFFERYGDRSAVVNGVSVGSISHDACTRLMLTGRRSGGSDLSSLLASHLGAALPMPYVVLDGPRFPGPLGSLMVPMSETLGDVLRGEAPEAHPADPNTEAQILSYLRDEADARGGGARAEAWSDSLARYRELLSDAEALRVRGEPTAQSITDLAALLLGQGLCATLTLSFPLPPFGRWDSHHNNDALQTMCYESSFGDLITLLDTLETTPGAGGGSLLEETTVLVLSEMGRTPVMNDSGGKDHWPYTSALLLGAGVAGGRVLGATDETMTAAPVDFGSGEASSSGDRVSGASLLAGVAQLFEMDPAELYPEAEPFTAIIG